EKARQRVDQYRRRQKLQARKRRVAVKPDYSYDRENLRPLGLQLFLEKVRPTPMPLGDVMGAAPQPRLPHLVDSAPQSKPEAVELVALRRVAQRRAAQRFREDQAGRDVRSARFTSGVVAT